MSNLLQEIGKISEEAAKEIKNAGFEADSDIRSLNRQDLLELLPGNNQLRVRKEIHERICQLQNTKCSLETKCKEIMELLTSACTDGLIDERSLHEYSHMLKTFTDKLINSLERKNGDPSVEPSEGENSGHSVHDPPASEAKESYWQRSMSNVRSHVDSFLQIGQVTVRYTMMVSGKTLEKHLDVIAKLNGQVPGRSVSLELKEVQDEDSQVTIVFCPIVSRMVPDVDEALQHISSDKPIILVVMHHMHTPTGYPAPKTNNKIHLGVNVFFHETSGLLNCSQNNEAIYEVKAKLLEFSTKKSCINPQ